MSLKKRRFIVIDDNRLDGFIAEKIILNTGLSENISVYMDAREALESIRKDTVSDFDKRVILVDIQMPLMNGFEFVEAFEELPATTKAQYAIFMLTSSINQSDISRISNYNSVVQLLNKPLSSVKFSSMMDSLNS